MRIGDPICGDHGPRFVGYEDEPKLSFLERWGATVAIAAALFVSSMLIVAVLR